MEEYLNQTKGFLGVIQSILNQEERKRSTDAANEIYQEIRKVVEKYDLNIREMLNASLALQATILQLALEQMEDRRHKEEK
jgi:16S rRNA C1402 N4-methylase RsmH